MDDDRDLFDKEEMLEEGIPVSGDSLFADEDETTLDDEEEPLVPEGFTVEEEEPEF